MASRRVGCVVPASVTTMLDQSGMAYRIEPTGAGKARLYLNGRLVGAFPTTGEVNKSTEIAARTAVRRMVAQGAAQ